MAKSADMKKQEAHKVNSTKAAYATLATLNTLSDIATRIAGQGVVVLRSPASGKVRGGKRETPVDVFDASQYGKSKAASAGTYKAGHAHIYISQACTLKEVQECLAKGLYTLKFHQPIKGDASLEPRKADPFTGKDLTGKPGKAEWKWARAQLAPFSSQIAKLYWSPLKAVSSAKRDATKAKQEAAKQEAEKGMSEAEKALSAFREANKLPKVRWTLDGAKMDKLPLDQVERIQGAMTKAMAKRVVINAADLTKAKAYRDEITPLVDAALKSQPATASTAEKSQADTKAKAKRANKVAGVKATPSLRAESAKAS
tara:strand:- start:751 stop:1692 length:942 start_codon:yes stop_codon:yes gene_type:complete